MKTEEFPMRKGFYAQIKKLLMLFCLLFSLSLTTSCSDSEDEPKEEIQEETTGSTGSNSESSETINGHEYVNLGLPSGLKWATCNIGAIKPEDYGEYYAWGETTTKSKYTWNSITMEKEMGDISGNVQYDAARANWGGTWRMPESREIVELINNRTCIYTSQNGVKGYKVMGKNGNFIFLPAAGCLAETSLYGAGYEGLYWSSTPHEDFTISAYGLYFRPNRCYSREFVNRFYGRSVRPVTY